MRKLLILLTVPNFVLMVSATQAKLMMLRRRNRKVVLWLRLQMLLSLLPLQIYVLRNLLLMTQQLMMMMIMFETLCTERGFHLCFLHQ